MISQTRIPDRRSAPSANHVVIDGTFLSGDARDIVGALLDSMIQGHKLRNLRNHVHRECPDANALDAIRQLSATKAQLRTVLQAAAGSNTRVRVRSTIEFEVQNESSV